MTPDSWTMRHIHFYGFHYSTFSCLHSSDSMLFDLVPNASKTHSDSCHRMHFQLNVLLSKQKFTKKKIKIVRRILNFPEVGQFQYVLCVPWLFQCRAALLQNQLLRIVSTLRNAPLQKVELKHWFPPISLQANRQSTRHMDREFGKRGLAGSIGENEESILRNTFRCERYAKAIHADDIAKGCRPTEICAIEGNRCAAQHNQ